MLHFNVLYYLTMRDSWQSEQGKLQDAHLQSKGGGSISIMSML